MIGNIGSIGKVMKNYRVFAGAISDPKAARSRNLSIRNKKEEERAGRNRKILALRNKQKS